MPPKRTPATPPLAPPRSPYMLIEEIRVQGYKSLVDATLHVRPLTLLAGTNSSGKSSIMQPLLLIKQTMEAPYNPAGALLLDGGHVRADHADQLLCAVSGHQTNLFNCKITGRELLDDNQTVTSSGFGVSFIKKKMGFDFAGQITKLNGETIEVSLDSSWDDIRPQFSEKKQNELLEQGVAEAMVIPATGFVEVVFFDDDSDVVEIQSLHRYENEVLNIMHIPGLRSAPQRSYPYARYSHKTRGTYDAYVAGIINEWQQENEIKELTQLNDSLRRLGLTDTVTAKVKNANEVELSVSRLPAGTKGKARKADMVNIADVGIGVSQVLPILVALIAAQPGQLVYIEQPELHLHPRAQVVMAELLAEAANRGVRVVVETHSSLLLLTVQTLIAQGRIQNTDVAMHWFSRDARGATKVDYVQPDEDGACGDWPEDFGDVELKAQDAYLTAVGRRHFGAAPQV